jgi:hypothetical protein
MSTTTNGTATLSRKERRKDRPTNQQCSFCEHVGTDVQDCDGSLACAACRAPADANLDAITPTAHPEPSPVEPTAPQATPQPTSVDAIAKAQEALWDEAIDADNAIEYAAVGSSVHIGELILRSFDLIRPGLAVGRETREGYALCMAAFGTRYGIKTKRTPQTSRWVNAFLAYHLASDAVKPLILGSASAPFACDTLVALAQDAHDHDPTVKTRRGLVVLDNDTMQWVLEDNTDAGQAAYDQLIRDIVEKGYTADAVRKEVKAIKRRALAGRETQAQKEQREQAEKAERVKSRREEKDRAVGTLVKTAEKLAAIGMPISKEEMTATLLGAGLILNPKGYDPNNMTPNDAKQFAMELIASCNLEAMAIIHRALTDHSAALNAALNADKQPSKRATAVVNDAPHAPKPDDNPVSAAA